MALGQGEACSALGKIQINKLDHRAILRCAFSDFWEMFLAYGVEKELVRETPFVFRCAFFYSFMQSVTRVARLGSA